MRRGKEEEEEGEETQGTAAPPGCANLTLTKITK